MTIKGTIMDKQFLKKFLEDHPVAGEFKPYVYYNVDGNQLEFYWDNESDYSREVRGEKYNVGHLMYGQESGKVVGATIYSIKQILQRAGFKLVPMTDEERCELGMEEMGFIKKGSEECA
jgi:hypothetical protein